MRDKKKNYDNRSSKTEKLISKIENNYLAIEQTMVEIKALFNKEDVVNVERY